MMSQEWLDRLADAVALLFAGNIRGAGDCLGLIAEDYLRQVECCPMLNVGAETPRPTDDPVAVRAVVFRHTRQVVTHRVVVLQDLAASAIGLASLVRDLEVELARHRDEWRREAAQAHVHREHAETSVFFTVDVWEPGRVESAFGGVAAR